jgi:ribonuclease HI
LASNKSSIAAFNAERERLNELVLTHANLPIKRFFSLDGQTYRDDGALSKQTKEMLGMVASLVLRCDDCITYHLLECDKAGVTTEMVVEASSVALIVGGSIVIPHLRRAMDVWQTLQEAKKSS